MLGVVTVKRKQHPAHVVERRRNWATLLDVHTAAARSDRRWDPFADSRAGTRWVERHGEPASENGYEGVIFIARLCDLGARRSLRLSEISWCIGTGAVTGAGGATWCERHRRRDRLDRLPLHERLSQWRNPQCVPSMSVSYVLEFLYWCVNPHVPSMSVSYVLEFLYWWRNPTYPLCQCPRCSNFCTGGGTPTYPLCTCPTAHLHENLFLLASFSIQSHALAPNTTDSKSCQSGGKSAT